MMASAMGKRLSRLALAAKMVAITLRGRCWRVGFLLKTKLQSLPAYYYRLTRGNGMKVLFGSICVLCALLLGTPLAAQIASSLKGPDERFKADILVVVAHPDDEGAVTPYLARAIYDL